MTTDSERSGWAEAMDALGRAGDRFAAQMAERGSPVDSGDIYATMLGALSDTYLNQLGVGADCPSFVPCTGYFQRLGSPNPDTAYRRAPVDPAGTYRLVGQRGTAGDVTIMPFTQAMKSSTPFDLSGVSHGPEGRFDFVVSAERPADHTGDWWQLDLETASLWLREVSDRWGEEEPATIAITRLDGGSRTRVPSARSDAILATFAMRVERTVEYGIRHADELAEEGFVNRLKTIDYSASGAMPLQYYDEAIFQLGDDEALLVEAHLPVDCNYFSWSLTDRMLVTLDWMNAHTSLNRSQARIDPDGVLRVVVSASDPGAANWMETMGYPLGVLQCRSAGCQQSPEMTAQVVPLKSVFDHLPESSARVSPEQRREDLRRRQVGAQSRRLW